VRRRVAAVAAAVALALTVGACGSTGSGDALARQACIHVERSLRLYTEAQRTTSPAEALAKVREAYHELRSALPLAAAATSANGQWVALETTISESARVDEGRLIGNLRSECAVAESPNPDQPPLPTSVPTAP
jgi:hypothetical protein